MSVGEMHDRCMVKKTDFMITTLVYHKCFVALYNNATALGISEVLVSY